MAVVAQADAASKSQIGCDAWLDSEATTSRLAFLQKASSENQGNALDYLGAQRREE